MRYELQVPRGKAALLGFWMKGCFLGAQFLNKQPELFDTF
jgi:murein endopeptidase